ncbi:hypothetical protein [Streptomyces sp. NPDC093544]|uniref:hypothetical protein n=1 Tax=Streptomyces sp. NPDC093544 TaxID=3155200 RepID=UPI00343C246D
MTPKREHFVEVDEDIPMTVQWAGYASLREAPRSVVLDAGASLVEVKTDRDTSEVVELVLIDIARPESREAPLDAPGVLDPGVPLVVFDESSQPQDRSAGGVRLYADGVRIRLGEGHAARGVGDSGAVFGFSDPGHWIKFDVRLDPDRMARLRALCRAGDA